MDVNWIWKVESHPGIYTGIFWERLDNGHLLFVIAYPYQVRKDTGFLLKKVETFLRQDDEVLVGTSSNEIKDELSRDIRYYTDSAGGAPSFNQNLKTNSCQILLNNFDEIRPLIDKVVIKEML